MGSPVGNVCDDDGSDVWSMDSTEDNQNTQISLLLKLPTELIENILVNLSYDQISKARPVCRRFNQICSSILNSSFQRLQSLMLQRFQHLKSQMPRRESARRQHPLARQSDIIETLHMRLTLLQMTFGKHIERKHCCFFAGGILDEVYRILLYVEKTPSLGRAYKVTDELFDLSTMAMEYFKEYIEPRLPEIAYFGTEFLDFPFSGNAGSKSSSWKLMDSPVPSSSQSESGSSAPTVEAKERKRTATNRILRKRVRCLQQRVKRCNTQLTSVRGDLKLCRNKLVTQQKTVTEFRARLDENDRKFEEHSRKFSALLQELNKCKTEFQYWRSKSPAICGSCGHVVQSADELKCAPLNGGVNIGAGPSNQQEVMEDYAPFAKIDDSADLSVNFIPICPESNRSDKDVCIEAKKSDDGSVEPSFYLLPDASVIEQENCESVPKPAPKRKSESDEANFNLPSTSKRICRTNVNE